MASTLQLLAPRLQEKGFNAVEFYNVYDCWARDIASINADSTVVMTGEPVSAPLPLASQPHMAGMCNLVIAGVAACLPPAAVACLPGCTFGALVHLPSLAIPTAFCQNMHSPKQSKDTLCWRAPRSALLHFATEVPPLNSPPDTLCRARSRNRGHRQRRADSGL